MIKSKINMLEDLPPSLRIVSEKTTFLEPNTVPKLLIDLLDTAYEDITTQLQKGKTFRERGITTRPAIYLCKLDDLRRFQYFGTGRPKHGEMQAMYNGIAHAIYLPTEEINKSLAAKDDNARQSVYEEMIHALTSHYDLTTRTSQDGFRKTHIESERKHLRHLRARRPRETWEFYNWQLASKVTDADIQQGSQHGDEYQQNVASTENTTSLIRFLLTMPNNGEIAAIDFSSELPKATAIATKKQLLNIYAELSQGKNLPTELLDILASGDESRLQKLIDSVHIKNLKKTLRLKKIEELILVKSPVALSLRRILQSLTNPSYGIEMLEVQTSD